MKILNRHITLTLLLVLLLGSVSNSAWAYRVTYHVLTLPIDASETHMVSDVNGKRLEAIKVFVDNATTIELPAHFKSPLATNFKYYKADQVDKIDSHTSLRLHSGSDRVKGYIYSLKDGAVETAEGATVDANMDIYVTYDYIYAGNEAANTIAKLDGSVSYNIGAKKGFLALNRGRNNRPAVVPKEMVSDAQLTSEDFVKVNVSGSGITTYWSSDNPRANVESQFHFLFKLEGNDPYNIIIRTAYAKDSTYMEKEADNSNHFKYYKESSIFVQGNGQNAYLASDEHKAYNKDYVKANYPTYASFPTDLSESAGNGWTDSPGFFHGQGSPMWNTFALLNNTTGDGYVFMGSRTYNNNGTFSDPTGSNNNYSYNYLKFDNANLRIDKLTPANATKDYATDQQFYPVRTVTFKVKTPFGNTVSAPVTMSGYKVANADISMSDIPTSLERKYCSFTRFYNDAALTQEITKYSQMTGDDIYIGYQVSASIPFKAITPGSYDANTWKRATWYELTDDGSTEESGKKIKYDAESTTFKNNGAHNEFRKTSEYAFIGDPYELQVVLRSATADATPSYVGAASEGNLGISTSDGAGYHWEMPDDDTAGSFLLRRYGGEGHWAWDTGNRSIALTYGTNKTEDTPLTSDAQTVTLNISGLTYAAGNYIKVTKGGTDEGQVTATVPELTSGTSDVEADGTAIVTATIDANSSGANKTFTLTIQEYKSNNSAEGSATTITITQGTTAFSGSTVEYSTTASTRVKAMELSNAKYTYKIVDKAGRIAAKATTTQPIYSPLSIATIPSIIVSPFIVDEAVTFYDSYTDRNSDGVTDRRDLSGQTPITETPDVDDPEVGAVIYVTYTTAHLDEKPFNLSEDQEIFVRLNGQYIYYDAASGTLKSTVESHEDDKYKWKLRNLDPYAMLLDNLGARTALGATGNERVTVPTDDNGTTSSELRQVGAWVKLAAAVGNDVALAFDIDRTQAQPFIAKSSARAGVYEVMVATGDGVDASKTYYNIGRPDENTVKIYSNATYQAGDDDEIKFRLEENTEYTYHLIDKSKHELLTVTSKSPELVLPAEWQSPLVGAANYHYYDVDQFNISEGVYTLKSSPTELTNISSLLATFTKTASDAVTYDALGESEKLVAETEPDMESDAKKKTSTGDYYYKVGSNDYYHVEVTKPCYTDIYVTYDKNSLVTFSNSNPYLLKFLNPYAAGYQLEDGNDRLTSENIQALYPYTNGDGNLNIYGQAMNDEQMNGGSSTRPRWVWYFNNPAGYTDDPYHVTIHSKSTISYNGVSHQTYLQTYAVHFNQDDDPDTKHIVTGGNLSGISNVNPTEYMVLGTEGHYRLMTTHPIAADLNGDGDTDDEGENVRHTVNSFEQYWKTYNMLKLYVLGIANTTDAFSDDPATWVVPDEHRATIEGRDWHSYDAYANATRWNGYNNVSTGHASKVVERLEHWFQTFYMGDGSFDIISANIPPVLVLIDRHGWEIMRKPLPTTNYPNGEELEALRAYDSPMVKEYHFFSQATKASGCHKYSLRVQNGALRDAIKVNGTAYTSTSLAALPPATATGVKSSGDFQDQFVTYTVKEEYEKCYDYSLAADSLTETGTASKFLVLQNGRFLKDINQANSPSYFSKPIYEHTNPEGGNVYDLILAPQNNTVTVLDGSGKLSNNNYYYVKPNLNIDREMGIKWGAANSGAEPMTEKGTKALYANSSKEAYMMTTGFDPYNIQLQNVGTSKYLTTHFSKTKLENGAFVGDYSGDGDNVNITLEDEFSFADIDPNDDTGSEGHDHTNIAMTNQTFMAVQDENGNMQLMPRFDHTKRINTDKTSPYFTTLADPVDHSQKASVSVNESMGPQTTFLVRPQIQEYIIVDNQGREALRYKRAGDDFPTIPDHFKSPLAKDFIYYKNLTLTDGVYQEIPDATDISSKQITGSFAEAGLKSNDATIYVRYNYNADADDDGYHILRGKWFTLTLNNLDVKASGTINVSDGTGVSLYADDTETPTKPGTINSSAKEWQWKFLKAPVDESSSLYVAPDPYAVQIFNRQANYSTDLSESSPMGIGIKVNGADRFALLSHPLGGYALAVDGLGTYNYTFLNGASMTTSVAATTAVESNFTSKANGIDDIHSQLLLNDEVTRTFTYNIINNDKILAAHATQTTAEASSRDFKPYVPEEIQTPLLDADEDYLYYGNATIDNNGTPGDASDDTYTAAEVSKLRTIQGLYDDALYVRYVPFDREKTPFFVPNVRNDITPTPPEKVEVSDASNDVAFDLSGDLPYNIIWLNDNMMESTDGSTITDGGQRALSGNEYIWKFEGNDPYAIKIRHNGGNYVDGDATLNATAKDFMLLKRDGYDYGVLAETGNQGTMLSGYGQTTTTSAPNKYIIFALSVYKLIYHLVINNTGNTTNIPYREGDEKTYTTASTWESTNIETIPGTTQRDLTNYAIDDFDAGQVSLGDDLEVPGTFYRPNCRFYYYVEGVYETDGTTPKGDLNNRFKGLKVTKLMSDPALIGYTVKVNMTYAFDTGLETNAGGDFVKSVDDNLWYTYEANAATPKLAQYTGSLQTQSGYATHYTNDYLWTPLGDPYGFKMYNRYIYKNMAHPNTVMTTTSLGDNVNIEMRSDNTANSVYELLADASTTPGYFLVHPVANNTAPQYYMRDDGGTMKLSTTPSEWTYGLSEDVMRPYYERAGYVGGLNAAGKAAYEEASAIENPFTKLVTLQGVVYDHDNDGSDPESPNYIVHFTPGYYRLHSQPGSESISTPRYASGYLHDIEKTAGAGSTALPLHFYSRKGVSTTYAGEGGLSSGFTESPATRGELPILATEYDPSSIFYVTGTTSAATMQTQGLNVIQNTMGTGTATPFTITDIGAGIVAFNNSTNYLCYKQDAPIYDLKYGSYTSMESARWCMEPANNMGLEVTMNYGGDGYYYATFYAPFDVLLPSDADSKTYNAYICTEWSNTNLHPVKVPAVEDTYDAGKFVPAGTPVILRTTDNTGHFKLTLPRTSASSALTCAFTGSYLEQMLAADASRDVYTLGLPFTSTVTINRTDGSITAALLTQATSGIAFYINATPNKENDALESMWTRNNRYVLHNKIYYRAAASPAPGLSMPQSIPVVFGDDAEEDPEAERWQPTGDGCVYDLQGRRVAGQQQVLDGTWRQTVAPGIYILNGKKIRR